MAGVTHRRSDNGQNIWKSRAIDQQNRKISNKPASNAAPLPISKLTCDAARIRRKVIFILYCAFRNNIKIILEVVFW